MKSFIKLTAALCVVASFASCDEDQSTFDAGKIPGKAVVSGIVTFNEGTAVSNGRFEYTMTPAANLKLIAIVDNTAFGNEGISTFETTTDADGKYCFELPATYAGVSYTITSASFVQPQQVVKKFNNQVVTEMQNTVFYANSNVKVYQYDIVYNNITCSQGSVETTPYPLDKTVTFSGYIGRNTEIKTDIKTKYDDDGYFDGFEAAKLERCYVGAPNADVIVTVKNAAVDADFVYNVTTDGSGYYSVRVPVQSYPVNVTAKFEAMPKTGSFTIYEPIYVERTYGSRTYTVRDYQAHTLQGWFEPRSAGTKSISWANSIVKNDEVDVALLEFFPYGNDDDYGYNSSYYTKWYSELRNK